MGERSFKYKKDQNVALEEVIKKNISTETEYFLDLITKDGLATYEEACRNLNMLLFEFEGQKNKRSGIKMLSENLGFLEEFKQSHEENRKANVKRIIRILTDDGQNSFEHAWQNWIGVKKMYQGKNQNEEVRREHRRFADMLDDAFAVIDADHKNNMAQIEKLELKEIADIANRVIKN